MLLASLVKREAALNIEYCTFTRPIAAQCARLSSQPPPPFTPVLVTSCRVVTITGRLESCIHKTRTTPKLLQTICTQNRHKIPCFILLLYLVVSRLRIRHFHLKMYTCNASIDIAASPEHVRSKVSLSSFNNSWKFR
jgi:hypothetical protein